MNANLKQLTPIDAMFTVNMNGENYYEYYKNYGYNDSQIKNLHYTAKELFNIFWKGKMKILLRIFRF